MKSFKPLVLRWLFCCSLALMAGCASSELVDIWSDTSFNGPVLSKALVISVGKTAVRRRIWEDAFTAELANHHVAATPSYTLFPDSVPDTNRVILVVRSRSFDGVLVSRWLPPEMTTQYLEGYETSEQDMRYDPRRKSFVTYYRDIEHAAHVDSQKVVIHTIDVWATGKEGHLIWSATSKTPEPSSMQGVRQDIVKLVMSELARRAIIAPER